MAYEKQTWVTGEVITKEKLNHMEDGIANGGGGSGIFIANLDNDASRLDKTWNEIHTALENRQPSYACLSQGNDEIMLPILGAYYSGSLNTYGIIMLNSSKSQLSVSNLTTDNPDGYPTEAAQ